MVEVVEPEVVPEALENTLHFQLLMAEPGEL
jgi:hypothetical protein